MKKNKKTITVITSLLLIIVILGVILYLLIIKEKDEKTLESNDNLENKETLDEFETINYEYTDDGPVFLCSSELNYNKTYSYEKGGYLYCGVYYELRNGTPGIKEIWFENTQDDDIEYVEVAELHSDWKLDTNSGIMHLTTDKPSVMGEGQYKVKFRVLPSTTKEKLNIIFKNIKFKNVNNEYFKTDDSVIELDIEKENNYEYKTAKDYKSITFYKFNPLKGYEEINKYNCKGETCFEYASQCTGYVDKDNGKILILDNSNAVLYDFNKGVIGTYSHNISYIDKYFIVEDSKTGKSGIIDLNGKVIKELTSDGYGKRVSVCIDRKSYSIEQDLIIEKKNDKYGIVKITKDEVVVEHQFDDIRLHNNKYFKAKQDNKWYLYNVENKEKVIEEGFKELFIVNDQIVMTQIDNALYIKDYKGNNIIEEKMEVFMEYNEGACCGGTSGIYITEEKGKITIMISEEKTDEEYVYINHKYEYNIKDKKLKKVS